MTLSKKNLIKMYINILGCNTLLNKKQISRNFYTLLSKKKRIIFDIIKNVQYLKFLIEFLNTQHKNNEHFLFTISKVYDDIIAYYKSEFNCSYITNKWFGGILTNFLTIKKNLELFSHYDINPTYTKKEQYILKKKKEKRINTFESINTIKKLPNIIIFLADDTNFTPVKECIDLGIIPITTLNLNNNFSVSPYVIPLNQNSSLFMRFFLSSIFS